MRFARGTPVRLELTKWGEHPHWQMPAVYLGADAFGDWVGFPVGTHMTRPGASYTTANLQVGLVPDAPYLATFHGPGFTIWTYVDMTTVPVWDGDVLRAVDLDLDVIERLDHTTYVDDEDEFADHQVRFGYPPEVIDLARASCTSVLAAVSGGTAPFDRVSGQRWLDVLAGLEP